MSESHDAAAPVRSDPGGAMPDGAGDREAGQHLSRRPWFGRMLEDAAIELGAFRPGSRVFAIASAGCTALALARRGDRVTAVDIHPGQIELIRRRLTGAPRPEARMDRWLEEGRVRVLHREWAPGVLETFLRLVDLREQVRMWRETIATPRFRALVRAAVGRPRAAGERTGFPVGWAPPRFGAHVLARLDRCVALHPNRWNPYLWWMLAGRAAPGTVSDTPIRPDRLRLRVAEACQWLEAHPHARFDGFTLSNVLDGASEGQRRRLVEAVRRAAEPGATVVLRSLAGSDDPSAARNATRDRSGIWGGIDILPVSALRD